MKHLIFISLALVGMFSGYLAATMEKNAKPPQRKIMNTGSVPVLRQAKQPRTRYFFFSYSSPNGFGSMTFYNSEGIFPPNRWIRGKVAEFRNTDTNSIVVINLFEFKNKQDFEDFRR